MSGLGAAGLGGCRRFKKPVAFAWRCSTEREMGCQGACAVCCLLAVVGKTHCSFRDLTVNISLVTTCTHLKKETSLLLAFFVFAFYSNPLRSSL